MKILFILSRDVMFFHGSGEVETKLLQIGFQLLGHECHVAGLDSGDFSEYDLYCLFSIRDDVLTLLDSIPAQRSCLIVPQVDSLEQSQAERIARHASHLRQMAVLSRSAEERQHLGALDPGLAVVHVDGWFLKPFVRDALSLVDEPAVRTGYWLAMVSPDRDAGLLEFARRVSDREQELLILSDRPSEHRARFGDLANVRFERRRAYGSRPWFSALDGCRGLYEPNPRLTCSVLEALWMGKAVVSPHASALNAALGRPLVASAESVEPAQAVPVETPRADLYSYHANFVAAAIEGHLCGGRSA